jgi:benzil reductase ((S)-benzoin forming)
MNVLITDTNSGFGHALAMEFLNTGASVYGISRWPNNRLNDFPDYYHLTQDLMKLDELKNNVINFLGNLETLDLVILNAGMLPEFKDIRKTPIENITSMLNVNLLANKLIVDIILERVPDVYQIVAISSGTAINGNRGWNGYAISKAALNTLIKLYAGEIPDTHFSAIEPGIIDAETDEEIYSLLNKSPRDVNGQLEINKNGKITNPKYAANYMVEAMGIILQEESGTYSEVRDILLAPELGY